MYLSDRPVADMQPLACSHPCAGCPVRDLAVCNALNPDELAAFRRSGTDKLLAPGEALCWEGDAAGHVFTVTSGVLRMSKLLHDGRRQVTGFAFPGDFLGVTLEDEHPFTVEAVAESRLCRFPRVRFDAFVEAHPHMERRLYAVAATELSAARDQLVLLGRKTAVERLASFILQMARRTRQHPGDPLRATLPMSRMDIADYLGLRIETVSRELSALKRARLVRMTSIHDLIVHDPAGLEALAAVDR
ncbi:MAG: helix-turn-helix domain-containing protein [Sphingomonas sp.]|uniref:Crp/Fnr family transcriptional regulator n=1 Tax=Sphingomonas sp. TaxID=28214 RepID=UPI002273CE4C|nr:helix-turn-helix domain-containing protein [Sphingomonas sp.]MCX8474786.1 helix-turn-helix domain-containing protein [Sphingomonas sp.]